MDGSSKLHYLFWGLLLTVLDAKVNGFHVLPDVIGYALIFYGAIGLMIHSKSFLLAKNLAFLLVLFSLGYYAIKFSDYEGSRYFDYTYLFLDIALVWNLMGGLINMGKRQSADYIVKKASSYRVMYLILITLMASTHQVHEYLPQYIGLFIWFLVAATLLIMILILKLIHQSKFILSFHR